MRNYQVEAVVLRTHKLGEADRIITLLSRERGKLRAVAKGVRRTRSKFGARLEPFSRVQLFIAPGKNLDIITQAESLNVYGEALALDYPLWTMGQTILETADRISSEEGVPIETQYLLLVGALKSLTSKEHDGQLVLNAYLLRALALAGYAPVLLECAICGLPGAQPFFNVASGGALCAQHRQPGSVAPKPETVALLVALIQGDWEIADSASTAVSREASGLVSAYTQWHLERTLKSLPFVDRQTP